MAIKRNPDGIPEDIPTTKPTDAPAETNARNVGLNISVDLNTSTPEDLPTVKPASSDQNTDGPTMPNVGERNIVAASESPSQAPTRNRLTDDPTQIFGKSNAQGVEQTPATHGFRQSTRALDDGKTTIGGRGVDVDSLAVSAAVSSAQNPQQNPMDDPVAGWLVVVQGPGKGSVLNVGFGVNTIGRGDEAKITLNFGDKEISRDNHAMVVYDPKNTQFYLQPGTGTNLTYVEGQATPVLQTQMLEPFSHINIGNTHLRFVPLCGADFKWDFSSEE